MDVVLASGELVTASETENSDLFWAARGSGPGFFGIVVRFRLKTRWSPLAMHHSTFIFPAKAHVKEVLCWLQRIA
jgi:FAD/FMN-containing dehydrogenase